MSEKVHGGKEEVVGDVRMGAHPGTKELRDRTRLGRWLRIGGMWAQKILMAQRAGLTEE